MPIPDPPELPPIPNPDSLSLDYRIGGGAPVVMKDGAVVVTLQVPPAPRYINRFYTHTFFGKDQVVLGNYYGQLYLLNARTGELLRSCPECLFHFGTINSP